MGFDMCFDVVVTFPGDRMPPRGDVLTCGISPSMQEWKEELLVFEAFQKDGGCAVKVPTEKRREMRSAGRFLCRRRDVGTVVNPEAVIR